MFAVAAPGLEPVLLEECRALGLGVVAGELGGVALAGGADALYRANLELRTATRVLVRVAQFGARLFAELERRARRIDWAPYLAPRGAVAFRVSCRKSRLYHQEAIAQRLAEAAAARVSGVVPDGVPPEGREVEGEEVEGGRARSLIVVRVVRDRFTISVDSSGELLHRRGYRLATARAPLRETLAAAMLRASGWDERAPLVDPLAGSGTIPIEAALIARRIAPGLARRFAFEGWPSFEADQWQRLVSEARARVLACAPGPILGFDRDAGAIEDARANAERAGVAGDLELAVRPISALPPLGEPGWLVTNPPYGARVGDHRSLRNLYARLGAVFRERCPPGSRLALLVARREHERALGMPLEECFRTTNGGIPVRCLAAAVGR
jgi:putative N6-adenine-specific DNA methylase